MSLVRVGFKKMASDGNYGSETAECVLEVDVELAADEVPSEVVESLLAQCRRQVHDELRNSPSRTVQRAVEYPKPLPAKVDDDDNLEDLPY